jgi:predicted glycoside hydrolase/deacetylase ChbG (UPF0249 family)
MKNLIVNADDLGWTRGVNRGIDEAHQNGIVTSTSLLANAKRSTMAWRQRKAAKTWGGVAFESGDANRCAGLNVKSLLNEAGEFSSDQRRCCFG